MARPLSTVEPSIRAPPGPGASDAGRGIAHQTAVSRAVSTSTGTSHHRTGVIRVKNGVSTTSVGTPMTRALSAAATTNVTGLRSRVVGLPASDRGVTNDILGYSVDQDPAAALARAPGLP